MRNAKAIYLKELRSYFNSPMAYIFLVIFAVLSGYFFTSTFFLIGQSDMRALFNIVPLVYLFFVPAISMGLIAKEKNLGTMEVLATMPIQDVEFVTGKYVAAVSLIVVGLLFTLVHFLTLLAVGTHVDVGAVITGYVGLVLVGAFYAAVGTFASSLTENQVVSLIIAIAIIMVFFLLDKLLLFIPAGLATIAQYMSVDYHLSNIARGVVDSRNLIYFAGMIWLFLALTLRVLEMRKWR
jgi:ABC-2 type transport system permease protein